MALYLGSNKISPVTTVERKEKGTAIVPSKEIDRIYFNTNNSIETTNRILSELTFVQTPFLTYPIYPVYARTSDGVTGSFIIVIKTEDAYVISEVKNVQEVVGFDFYNSIASDNVFNNGWIALFKDTEYGWGFVYPNSMELRVYDPAITDYYGIPVGQENEKLKNVLSSTPFMTSGYEEGKKAQYDAFWDAYQQMGNRTNYRYAFYSQNNSVWDDKLYNPKYPITALDNYGGDSMYQNAPLTDTKVDIEIGVNASYTFISCYSLKTIRKLIVSENTTFYRWFDGCEALESVTFEGVIATDISFRDSAKLSNASVQNIIDHIKDLTGQTSQTLTLHATAGANLTQAQKDAITAKNWQLVY